MCILAHILLQKKMTMMTVIMAARMMAMRRNVTTRPAMRPSLFVTGTGGQRREGSVRSVLALLNLLKFAATSKNLD